MISTKQLNTNSNITYIVLSYLLINLMFSCSTKTGNAIEVNEDKRIRLSVDYQISHQIESNKEIDVLIAFVEEYLNTETYLEMLSFWETSGEEKLTIQIDLLNSDIKSKYPDFKPTVYAIEVLENNHFLLKIALMGKPEEFYSINSLFNLLAKYDCENQCFEFINTTNKKLETKNRFKKNNVIYYSDNEYISEDETTLSFEFEKKLASFLSMEIVPYKVVIFNNSKELNRFIGYEYEHSMYLNNSYAGLFIPYDNFILNANGSPFYPHEITHLYTKKKIGIKNNLVDEGFATFLGGSLGYDYPYHVNNLKGYVSKHKINLLESLKEENFYDNLVGISTSFKYSTGAFLCHVIYKEKGRTGLLDFLETGKTTTDLINNLELIFNLKEEDLEGFLREELVNFKEKVYPLENNNVSTYMT